MGWWEMTDENRGGIDFEKAIAKSEGKEVPPDTGLVMGDEPADIMTEALDKIIKAYEQDWKRKPTQREMKACFSFCFGGIEDELKP